MAAIPQTVPRLAALALSVCLPACWSEPPPPAAPDIRIGVTHSPGDDLAKLELALAGVNAEVVPLVGRSPEAARVTLDGLDALLLGPGADIDPKLYGD